MHPFSWLLKRITGRPHTRRTSARKPTLRFRPHLETLEDRNLPSFAAPVSDPVSHPTALMTADVNGDGKPDLLTLGGVGVPTANVQLNKGNGTFGTASMIANAGQTAAAMIVGDVNGDSKLDIVFANKYTGDPVVEGTPTGGVTVRLGTGQGTFGTPQVQTPFQNPVSSLALADVYGNGTRDLVGVPANGGTVYVARSEGYGNFAPAQSYSVPGNLLPRLGSSEVAVGNFTGDGKSDIVVTDPRLNSVSVLLNNGNGTFGTAQTYAVGGDPTAVAVGDVNGDGRLDIVTANSNGTVSVLLGQGNGTFAAVQNYTIGGPANSVVLGDFNQDGRLDIATTGSTEMDVLLNNGNAGFAAYQKVGPAGTSVVAADFNGDGFPDLAQIDASSGNVDVLMNLANWAPTPSFAVASFPASTTAGVPQTFTVTALNPDGSVDTGYSGTVHFSSSDPQAVLPANSTLTNGVGTFQATLKTAGSQSITATDAVTGGITGNESGISVTPAAAATLVFSVAPSSTSAGSDFLLTVTAKDAYGNTATGYTGTVHFTSSDAKAVLPANYTFGSSDAGQHTFFVTLETAGTQSVTAADTSNGSLTARSSGIVVTPGEAAKFVLSAPAGVSSGAKFSLTLTVEDADGNVATGYTGTVHFTSSDSTATLPKNYTFTSANAGVSSFSNVFGLKKKGVQTLTVTDTIYPTLTFTVSINVT